MANTPFTTFAFNATGGTTPRTMPNRLADIVNVKDYGAIGDDSHDDYPGVQAAFDAAFGTAASPHGSTNAKLNRPVFFPNGAYKMTSGTPTLTRVDGGKIFGAGPGATILSKSGAPILAINGACRLSVENFSFVGGTNALLVDLDWDGTTTNYTGGLHHNIFSRCLFSNFTHGLRIANSGNQGNNNLLNLCSFNGSGPGSSLIGVELVGANATENLAISGGASGCGAGYLCDAGTIDLYETSNAGNNADLQLDVNLPVGIFGGRGEPNDVGNRSFVVSDGILKVNGYTTTGSARVIAYITGGKVVVDAMSSSNIFDGTGGELYLRGCAMYNVAYKSTYISNGGTVVEDI